MVVRSIYFISSCCYYEVEWVLAGLDSLEIGHCQYGITFTSFSKRKILWCFPLMVRPFTAFGRLCMVRSFCQLIVYFSVLSPQFHRNEAIIVSVSFKMSPAGPQLKTEMVVPYFD